MIFITGDKHRDFTDVGVFCKRAETTKNDVLIVLGDAGINYYLGESDQAVKRELQALPVTFLFINGNHEERPENIEGYELVDIDEKDVRGKCYVEKQFPSLWFASNSEFTIAGKRCFVIGGAYSVDKYFRLRNGSMWFRSEELTEEEIDDIRKELHGEYDYFLAHTCPRRYEPVDSFLPWVNQDQVSKRMENFLDEVAENHPEAKWYCGHWHIDRALPEIQFMYVDFKTFQRGVKSV